MQGQIHPTDLIFDVLSEFEVKIDQKHDFDLFLKKLKKSDFSKNSKIFVKTHLNIKFSAFFYVTGSNQRNFEQKIQEKKIGRFGVIRF